VTQKALLALTFEGKRTLQPLRIGPFAFALDSFTPRSEHRYQSYLKFWTVKTYGNKQI